MTAQEDNATTAPTDGGPEDAVAAEAPSQEEGGDNPERRTSALRDNIERKGENAYYFAHAHKATGPKWDGKEEPKLLSTSSLSEHLPVSRSASTPHTFDFSKSNITSYAFCDDGATVKLYISLDGVGEKCSDDDITLESTDSSFCLMIENYRKDIRDVVKPPEIDLSANEEGEEQSPEEPPVEPLCLSVLKLTAPISKATFKIKKDRIVLSFKKVDGEKEWHTINDKGHTGHEVV